MIAVGLMIPMFSIFLWIIATILTISLPHSKHYRSLLIKRKIMLLLIFLPSIAVAVWICIVVIVWVQQGWLFVEGIVKVMIPLYLLGYLPVFFYSVPRLLSVRKKSSYRLSDSTKLALIHPLLIIPIIGATLSTAFNLYLNLFAVPVMSGFIEVFSRFFLYFILLSVPSVFIIRTYQSAKEKETTWNSGWQKMWKSLSITGLTLTILILFFSVGSIIGSTTSKLPASFDMMNHENMDHGGNHDTAMSSHSHHQNRNTHTNTIEVKKLTGDISAPADKKFTLVAEQKEITLPSGKKIDTWTYNGEIAPQIRVKEGEMVEIKLVNRNVPKGVTIHWHGYNVPNAMDGVPGMTQNIVKPGQSFTYKFRANQVGTYWFHSHQQASEQVQKGLFGVLIVEAKQEVHPYDQDFTLIYHQWNAGSAGGTVTLGNVDTEQQKKIAAGQKVRLRVINTDNNSQNFLLHGVAYRVTGIDGLDLTKPTDLPSGTAFSLASGGKYDITFTMPDNAVHFGQKKGNFEGQRTSPPILFYTATNQIQPIKLKQTGEFNPTNYGTGVQNDLTRTKKFDRKFQMIMGNKMGFYDGKFNYLWTINGEVFPNTPTFVVKERDKVKVTFINRSFGEHPMHLHGHHMTVLKKNGKPVTTPWMTDTLQLKMGESYEVAFTADNPGMWMDHCHNLDHAAVGMTMHLMYDHVTSSYEVGTKSGNIPD
jgi:FtsP/CotA-like multicopper oxidase with cupredoxin domain